MPKKILLTSFQTWLPHQNSNASDDLLIQIHEQIPLDNLTFLRQLPVDITRASERAIAAIEDLQPDTIICCGMAESRYLLTVEYRATSTHNFLTTSVDLEQLVSSLSHTAISYNAGKFVCEGLYYQVLKYTRQFSSEKECFFLHVPVLNGTNLPLFLSDCESILKFTNSQNC